MRDSLIDGRSLRTFNVLGDFDREGLAVDVDCSGQVILATVLYSAQ